MKATALLSMTALAALATTAHAAQPLECTNWQQAHPQWLWCDDFESDSSLEQNYYDVNRVGGKFGVVGDTAYGGTKALRNGYVKGVEGAGWLKLSIGKTPVSPKRYLDRNFEDVYWRFYMKTAPNWVGQGWKVTRATIFASSSWSQAAIGHLWSDNKLGLALDPVSGVSGSTVVTTGWNDFPNMKWIGAAAGPVQVYAPENRDKWYCIEVRMKLNTPGKADGEFTYWLDGQQQAQRTGLNFRGNYTAYGINTIMLEGWINNGSPQDQNRYFDNFVVSTAKIGCFAPTPVSPPAPPTGVKAGTT